MVYLKLLRPLQWIKNLFVFIPLVFARELFIPTKLGLTITAAAVFCLVASSVYIINDLFDREQDRLHPHKKNRPLAAGTVSVSQAVLIIIILLGVSIFMVLYYVPTIAVPIGVYFVLNILYSFYLKHQAIFDIVTVSFFYLLRILVGGLATSTYISRWLVLCVIFLATFIIIGKRRAELAHNHQRAVLRFYSTNFLDQLLTISAALTVVSYGIYSVLAVKSELMVYSILFVLVGIFRYLHIIHTSGAAETPEKIVLTDRILLGSVIGWLLYSGYLFYLV